MMASLIICFFNQFISIMQKFFSTIFITGKSFKFTYEERTKITLLKKENYKQKEGLGL